MKYIFLTLLLLLSANAKDMIVNVPITIIKDENKLPKDKVQINYKDIKFYIFENKDRTFSIFYKNIKNIKSLKNIKFNFKGANYIYELNKDMNIAVTTLMQRCDGVNRAGFVDINKKDGKIKGFPEKRCEGVSRKFNMMIETVKREERITKSKKEITKSKKEITKMKDSIARSNKVIADENKKQAKLQEIKELLESKK